MPSVSGCHSTWLSLVSCELQGQIRSSKITIATKPHPMQCILVITSGTYAMQLCMNDLSLFLIVDPEVGGRNAAWLTALFDAGGIIGMK